MAGKITKVSQPKFPKMGGGRGSEPLQSKRPKQAGMGKIPKKPAY